MEPKKLPEHNLVRVTTPMADLIQKMQQPRDVLIVASSDGTFTATCKSCNVAVNTAEQEDLIWYVCPVCRRSSFAPLANLRRDAEMAKMNGGSIWLEIFYFRELPEGFVPPI